MSIDSGIGKRYSVVDDGRVFTVALLSSLTWTFLRPDHSGPGPSPLQTLAVSMILIYLFGTPLARLAYVLAGRRPLAARVAFSMVTLTIVGLMAWNQ
jgi:predicted permease